MSKLLINDQGERIFPNIPGYNIGSSDLEYANNILQKALDEGCCKGNIPNSGLGVNMASQTYNWIDDCFVKFFDKGTENCQDTTYMRSCLMYLGILRDNCIADDGTLIQDVTKQRIYDYLSLFAQTTKHILWVLNIIMSYNGSLPLPTENTEDSLTNGCWNIEDPTSDDGWRYLSYPPKLYRYLRDNNALILFKDWHGDVGKKTYNTCTIDYRSPVAMKLIEDFLSIVAEVLEMSVDTPSINTDSNIASDKVKLKYFVGIMNPGIAGPWGEGNTKEIYYTVANYENGQAFIKVMEQYKYHFKDFPIVANTYGMRTGLTPEPLKDYQWYLMTTKYGDNTKIGEDGYIGGDKTFGLYQAHIQQTDTLNDLSIGKYWDDEEHDFKKLGFNKWKVAPVIGESPNATDLPVMELQNWHFLGFYTFNALNYSGYGLMNYLIKHYEATLGPRLVYISGLLTSMDTFHPVGGNKIQGNIRIANFGTTPLYKFLSNRYQFLIVARNYVDNSLVEVLNLNDWYSNLFREFFANPDNIVDRTLLDERKIGNFILKCLYLWLDITFQKDISKCNFYFRLVDKYHILNNYLFANKDVNEFGEYCLYQYVVYDHRSILYYWSENLPYTLSPMSNKGWNYDVADRTRVRYKLPVAYLKGYIFNGWYFDPGFTNKVPDELLEDWYSYYKLYPKFTPIKVNK